MFFFSDVEKLGKMKKLLEILSTPSKRMPLETLRKCEVVLEKMDLKWVSRKAYFYKYLYIVFN